LVEAIQIHQQAVHIGAKFSDGFYMLGANIAFQMGEYSRSIELLQPLEHSQNLNDRAQILSSLGANYDALGENQKALEFHRKAIEIARSQGSYRIYIEIVGNLLWCLASLNRSEEGFWDAEEALLLGSQYDTIHLRNNLAAAYFDCEKNTEALEHYEIIRQQNQHELFVALANARLSELYFKTRDLIRAQEALANSILFFETVEYPVVRIRIAIAVLKYGTSKQIGQISPFLDGLSSPDARTQNEFESLKQNVKTD
jgi:tetratricopeptide (TPR) repeat protein